MTPWRLINKQLTPIFMENTKANEQRANDIIHQTAVAKSVGSSNKPLLASRTARRQRLGEDPSSTSEPEPKRKTKKEHRASSSRSRSRATGHRDRERARKAKDSHKRKRASSSSSSSTCNEVFQQLLKAALRTSKKEKVKKEKKDKDKKDKHRK